MTEDLHMGDTIAHNNHLYYTHPTKQIHESHHHMMLFTNHHRKSLYCAQ